MRFVQAVAAYLGTTYKMDIEGAEEMIAGLMEGLIQKDDLPEIQKCLKNAESLEVELTGIIADLEKGDIQDIIKAAQEIGQVIKELPADLDDCKDIQGDVTKIVNWGKQFENPVKLVETLTKNVLAHWDPIQKDVKDLTTDYSSGKYYQTGEDIADITVQALGKISHAKEPEPLDLEKMLFPKIDLAHPFGQNLALF